MTEPDVLFIKFILFVIAAEVSNNKWSKIFFRLGATLFGISYVVATWAL